MPQTLNRLTKIVFDEAKSKQDVINSIENAQKKMETFDTQRLLATADE